MEHIHTVKFKIWVVNWPRNLVKLYARRQSDDDNDDDDDDDVISKHIAAIKYKKREKILRRRPATPIRNGSS